MRANADIAAPDHEPAQVVVAEPGEGVPTRAFGNEILFKLTADQSGGALSVGLATVPPGGQVPVHVHDRDDELFLIIEGRYRFCINGDWKDVGSGALVYLPRGIPHTFHTVGDHPGRHWVLTTPGGFDRFYTQCAEVFAAGGPPNMARLAEINAEHGYRIL